MFLKALAFASRRQLVIRAPGPFGVTSDERRVLALLAAAAIATPDSRERPHAVT